MSEEFWNLKKHVNVHLETQMYARNLQREAENEAIINRRETSERLIEEKLGAICYYLCVNERPDLDFPGLFLLRLLNCVDTGDFNHSKKVPAKFLRYVADEVQERTNSFLSSRLLQTGFQQYGKVLADKAKDRTR